MYKHIDHLYMYIFWHFNLKGYGLNLGWKVFWKQQQQFSTWASKYARKLPFISLILFHNKWTWKKWINIETNVAIFSQPLQGLETVLK